MRITCFCERWSDMGYIYLMPPVERGEDGTGKERDNALGKYVDVRQVRIPSIEVARLSERLEQMKKSELSFRDSENQVYQMYYGNDMDADGYVIGIELELGRDQLLDWIHKQPIQVLSTSWREQKWQVVTLAPIDEVFNEYNALYRLNDREDAYVIVKLVTPEDLGHEVFYSLDDLPDVQIMALVSARDDLYPPEYLAKPDFLLVESGD